MRYNIEMSQIKQKEGDEVERRNYSTGTRVAWASSLMAAIATTHMCRAVQSEGYENGKKIREFYLFGKSYNLEVVEYMYEYLAGEIHRLTPKKYDTTDSIYSFRMGCVNIIHKRLLESMQKFKESDSRALIVLDDKAVIEAQNRHFPHLRTARNPDAKDLAAYEEGKRVGAAIPFRPGMKGDNGGNPPALPG